VHCKTEEQQDDVIAHTEMVVSNAKVEQRAGITFDLGAALVK